MKNSANKQNSHICSTINSIQNKIKENNLTVTKADKGNSTVILSKEHYVQKVDNFLEKEKPTTLKSDPTNKIQNKLKNTLKNIEVIFTAKEKYRLINMNPMPPKLYGLIKVHKEGNPIRPVVSYINSPLRQMAIELNKIFKNLTNFTPSHSIRNSVELTNKLKDITLPENSLLASFDVSNMFSNIPYTDCLEIIKKILDAKNINVIIKNEIITLFELCLSENYFQFENTFYKQKQGLAMGSPLSPLMAELFMEEIEKTIFESPLSQKIFFWYRYVDDILICYSGNIQEIQETLTFINNIHPNISFTSEVEQNNQINFLDLTISRQNANKLSFNIYRKPTFSDATIPADSSHPFSHKIAAYRSMVNRAFSIPLSKENLNNEIDIIKEIATNNGFTIDIINNLVTQKYREITVSKIYPRIKENSDKKFVSLTYFGPLSEKISYVISKDNLRVAYKPSQKISNLFYNAKQKTDKNKKSGVYKLSCEECNSCYIGQTGRAFNIRYNEHLKSFENRKNNSNFANHFLEVNHSFPSIDKLEVLHYSTKSRKLNLLESIEIYKHWKNPNITLLNDQLDLGNSILFTALI